MGFSDINDFLETNEGEDFFKKIIELASKKRQRYLVQIADNKPLLRKISEEEFARIQKSKKGT